MASFDQLSIPFGDLLYLDVSLISPHVEPVVRLVITKGGLCEVSSLGSSALLPLLVSLLWCPGCSCDTQCCVLPALQLLLFPTTQNPSGAGSSISKLWGLCCFVFSGIREFARL